MLTDEVKWLEKGARSKDPRTNLVSEQSSGSLGHLVSRSGIKPRSAKKKKRLNVM